MFGPKKKTILDFIYGYAEEQHNTYKESLVIDDLSFSKKRLAEHKKEYDELMSNPKEWVREHIAWRIEDYKKIIELRKEAYEKSIENCKITNDWVNDLMESLK